MPPAAAEQPSCPLGGNRAAFPARQGPFSGQLCRAMFAPLLGFEAPQIPPVAGWLSGGQWLVAVGTVSELGSHSVPAPPGIQRRTTVISPR